MSSAIKPKTKNLLIRNLDLAIHGRLKARAHANHRSLEEEVRETLRRDLAREANPGKKETLLEIADRIFGKHGGIELELPPRGAAPGREPPDFSGPDYDP
jgi:plasmid stability protein